MELTVSEIRKLVEGRANDMTYSEIIDWLAAEIHESDRLDVELHALNKKLKTKDKELKRAKKALDLACESIHEHMRRCDAGVYSRTKERWIKIFEKEAKEAEKNDKKN